MTEQELQQYLLSKYPKENEKCEWKEFKNMKNDFNGKEKDDVISYVSALSNMEGGHLVIGVVDNVDTDNNSVRVVISMLGRETPVDLELDQVEAINN